MGLFAAVVGTLTETVKLPFDVVHDVVTLGGIIDENGQTHVGERLDKIALTAYILSDDD